jgi:hypothetical protein
MAMGRLNRAILPILLLGASLGLAGCEPGEMIDKLSDLIPNNKTPLPGTRKEVFPEGVPGVPQGVPPELVKGYQPPSDVAALPPPAAGTATHEPQTKSAAAEPPKPKKKKIAPAPSREPAEEQAAAPAQASQTPASQTPASQAPAPWPAPQPGSTAPWPAPQGQAAVAPWPGSPPTQRTQ